VKRKKSEKVKQEDNFYGKIESEELVFIPNK